MQIKLADAIKQLRNELRQAVLEGKGQDIVFTPRGVELELAVTFGVEAEAGGSFKLLTFLDLSTKAKATDSSQHKVKLTLDVASSDGTPLKIRASHQPDKD